MQYNITIQQHTIRGIHFVFKVAPKEKKRSDVRSGEWKGYSTKPLLPIHLSGKTSSKKTTKYHAGIVEVPNLAQLK